MHFSADNADFDRYANDHYDARVSLLLEGEVMTVAHGRRFCCFSVLSPSRGRYVS